MFLLDEEHVGPEIGRIPSWASSFRAPRIYPFSPISTVITPAPYEDSAVFYKATSQARFFRHPDLLTKLFDCFRKDDYTLEDRRQLLGFMLIQKASFHYPSQILWSRVRKKFGLALRNLLDIRMWDLGVERRLSGAAFLSTLEFNKSTLTSHIMWQKFLYYADAIQWIDATTLDVTPGTIALLSLLLPQSDPLLFRSLRQLRWTESSPCSDDLLCMLGPTLDELQLHVYDFYDGRYSSYVFSDWAARMLHAASHLCPHIRFLGIGGMGPVILSPSAIAYFGSLHRLAVTQRAFDSHEHIVAPPTSFHALEHLELASYQAANSLIACLPFVLPVMASTLRTVYIQSISMTSTLDTPSFIDNFRPLLHLPQLTTVYLNFALLDFKFMDCDLVTVAKAWPCIVEMGFAFRNLSWSPVPHLETIGVVATHCRALKKITVPYVLGPDREATFNISAPPSHPLQEIRVHAMTWDTSRNTAITLALKQAFPNISGAFDSTREDDRRELLWAILPPYILCSRLEQLAATSIPRNVSVL